MSDKERAKVVKEIAKDNDWTAEKVEARPGGFGYRFKEPGTPAIAIDSVVSTKHGTRDAYATVSQVIDGKVYALRYEIGSDLKIKPNTAEVLQLGANGQPVQGFKLDSLDRATQTKINRELGMVDINELNSLAGVSLETTASGPVKSAALDKPAPASPSMMA